MDWYHAAECMGRLRVRNPPKDSAEVALGDLPVRNHVDKADTQKVDIQTDVVMNCPLD